jgi:predicted HTH transcriptional regulator
VRRPSVFVVNDTGTDVVETLETVLDVVDRILGGEDSQTEFKAPRVDGHRMTGRDGNEERFAGEIVAFANDTGGIILVGVEDDGSLAGYSQKDAAVVIDWVVNVARNNVVPPINPVTRTHVLSGPEGPSRVVAVHIDTGLLHRTAGGRWYRRIGRDKRDLDAVEMERLIHERGTRFAFDESPVPGAELDDLDDELLHEVFPQPADIDWVQLLKNRRVLTGDGTTRPSLAGVLAFGRDPHDHLPQALIRAVVYRGTMMDGDTIHEQDLTGHVGRQIDEAVQLVDRHMRRGAVKDLVAHARPQFHLGAVMEAVVNAVAHRDYSIAGSRVRLLLFEDRLEVVSPGALPNTLDLDSMRYRQYTRNQLLVTFLARLRTSDGGRYIEERGEGVERIIRLSAELSGREPSFALHGDELVVTIWGAKPD